MKAQRKSSESQVGLFIAIDIASSPYWWYFLDALTQHSSQAFWELI
jgi:hypothetical protein